MTTVPGYENLRIVLRSRLKEVREARKLSQERLAHQAGLSLQGYRAIENGDTRSPRLEVARAIARILDTPMEELFPSQEVSA